MLVFFGLLAIGVPVAWAIGMASVATLLAVAAPMTALPVTAQQVLTSLDSFPMLAIPLFILAGQIMNQGGIATRLIEFAKSLVGALPGGLAHINAVAAMLFGSIAGSAVAAASAIGSTLGPKMEDAGYSKEFSAAVNITSSSTGLVIPPSNILIIYSLASGGTSIGALFLAGYIPGILMGLAIMVVVALWAKRQSIPVGAASTVKETSRSFIKATPSLLLLVVVIGGIVGGIFTATEAAAIAVVYAMGLGFAYREITARDLPGILFESAQTTAVVMMLIATSVAMSWVMTYGGLPQSMSAFFLGLSDNPIILLLIINLILLVVGMFMDMTPAVLIFTPIFLPVAVQLGVHPVHFGVIMVMNLCVGICTPPVGTLLFVGISIAGTTIEKMIRSLIPVVAAMIATLLIVTYVEELSLWLPRFFQLL